MHMYGVSFSVWSSMMSEPRTKKKLNAAVTCVVGALAAGEVCMCMCIVTCVVGALAAGEVGMLEMRLDRDDRLDAHLYICICIYM